MATTAAMLEQQVGSLPVNGRWDWREETNTLEYISNNPNADKKDKRKRQKGGIHFQDHAGGKRNDRVASGMGGRMGRGRGQLRSFIKSPKVGAKHADTPATVTLHDIKSVALEMLAEVDIISSTFEGMFNAEQFDEFLMYLLVYFDCFFEKRSLEEKPNPMFIEPSLAEKKAYADALAKLETAHKQLGQAYCVLVLGMGIISQHHMHCGGSRVSNTYQDRSMYETLYSFCSFVVWIAFRRKEYKVVKKELGRMLRSDTFNPAIRIKNAPDPEPNEDEIKEGEKKEKKEERKLTPAEYRRMQGKRPAIKSIINQRSPALVAILPSPKEESHWLFKRPTRATSPGSLNAVNNDSEKGDDDVCEELDWSKLRVGIVGEPMSQFNPMTLMPIGSENEDEENEEGADDRKRESTLGSTPHTKTPQHQTGVSRQATAVSQVTTEAPSSDDDE